jgi:hypothetical protein
MPDSINYARHLRKVYVFDGRENYLGQYETVKACAEALNVKRAAITMAATRASILDKKYYVSYKEKFTRKPKLKEFNPLRPSVRTARAPESKARPAKAPAKAAAAPVKKPVAAPTKTTGKKAHRLPSITALRSRASLTFLEEGFGPFSSFH